MDVYNQNNSLKMNRIRKHAHIYGMSWELANIIGLEEDRIDDFIDTLKEIILTTISEREIIFTITKQELEDAFDKAETKKKKKRGISGNSRNN